MTVQAKRNSFNSHEDARMHRLWNPSTRKYLHLSGKGETADVGLSWLGYAHQANTLRERAQIRGEEWPYRRRSRTEVKADLSSVEDAEDI